MATPAFANVCAFTDTILNSLLHFLEEPSRFDRASVFAALPAASCEILAEQSLSHVQAQFTKLESSLLTRNDERARLVIGEQRRRPSHAINPLLPLRDAKAPFFTSRLRW